MLYGSQHHIENSQTQRERTFYSVVGYICETDTFANNRRIAEIKEGIFSLLEMQEPIVSLWSNYNSRYKPAEVLWMNGEGHLIRAHETFEDLLKIKSHYHKQ
jgi:diaminopimelate decarboxylase